MCGLVLACASETRQNSWQFLGNQRPEQRYPGHPLKQSPCSIMSWRKIFRVGPWSRHSERQFYDQQERGTQLGCQTNPDRCASPSMSRSGYRTQLNPIVTWYSQSNVHPTGENKWYTNGDNRAARLVLESVKNRRLNCPKACSNSSPSGFPRYVSGWLATSLQWMYSNRFEQRKRIAGARFLLLVSHGCFQRY